MAPKVPSGKWQVFLGEEDLGVLDELELTVGDAFALENTAGVTIVEMLDGVNRRRAAASRALVWFMRLKAGGNVPHITTVDFKLADLRLVEVARDPS